jgi:hypothetical protein
MSEYGAQLREKQKLRRQFGMQEVQFKRFFREALRREGVTEGAVRLQQAGLIRYRRGHIKVLDRPGLEARTCECYAVVRNEYHRLQPDVAVATP